VNLGDRGLRVLTASLGLAMLAVGVCTVFETGNGAGSAALITIGVLLLGVGGLADRIEFIELGARSCIFEISPNSALLSRARRKRRGIATPLRNCVGRRMRAPAPSRYPRTSAQFNASGTNTDSSA
jgi:hypothetical protein